MFRNYLTVAVRNLVRHKVYSFINISGLAIGMACCILILLYVQDELSYDRYHENAERIYRVIHEVDRDGKITQSPTSPPPMAPALLHDFPEIIRAVRFARARTVMRHGDKLFHEPLFFADAAVFDVFDFRLMKSNPKTALQEPFSVVITKEIAEKYFGDEDPMSKILTFADGQNYKVTGVLQKIPPHSHFRFDVLASFVSLQETREASLVENWLLDILLYTYLLLPKDYPPAELESKLPDLIEKHAGEELRHRGWTFKLYLQPLTRIHLHSNLNLEIEPNGDMAYIYVFSAIAFFILLIACINFLNLATARSATRAKEVGIRKAVGAHRLQLIKQFLGESIFLTCIALLFAVALVEFSMPAFNALTSKALAIKYSDDLSVFLGLIGIALSVGVISGGYPAFSLSAFQPAEVLKGTSKTPRTSLFRRVLVTFQFAVSITLIIATSLIYAQMDYVRTKHLGLNKEHVVAMRIPGSYEAIKSELLQSPDVLGATASSDVPFRMKPGFLIRKWPVLPEGVQDDGAVPIATYLIDHDFVETLGIELVAGRNFSKDFATDATAAFILNETAVKKFGWTSPEAAIGKQLVWGNTKKGTVIGIVKDFHVQALYQRIEPMVFHISPRDFYYISVRISPDHISSTLDFLRSTWQKFRPGRPFEYFFLEDYFDSLHRADERIGQILGSFSLLAIFIACLGLFGLTSFATEQRTKEIGIRKILGASISGIVLLLTKEFTKWVLIANIIAWPIAYFAMNKWLQDFAYRIHIGVGTFLLAGAIALIIALLTVSFQAVKDALANPVDALRYE